MKRWWLVVAVLLAPSVPVSVWQARDVASTPAQAGGGVIRGRVISGDRPLRRALVTITGGTVTGNSVVTNDAGTFEIEGLPSGTYTLSVTKPAYLPAAFGAVRPGGAGTPIVVRGTDVIDVTITVTRGAVLAGSIIDAHGRPLAGVRVGALDLRGPGGIDNVFQSVAYVTTDDRGAFRIFGLKPSEYVVAATPRTSGVGEIAVRPVADVDALLAYLQQRRPGAQPPPGSRPVEAPEAIRATPDSVGYTPAYFPGLSRFAEASRIVLAAGEERGGLDFVVVPQRSASVEGTVSAPMSDASAVELTLVPEKPLLPASLAPSPVLQQPPDARGRFRYTNLSPGRYVILARAAGSAGPAAASSSVFGRADVEVTGQDVSGVAIVLAEGGGVAGRIRREGTAPFEVSSMRLQVVPTGGADRVSTDGRTRVGGGFGIVPAVPVQADGGFSIMGIPPGTYDLVATFAAADRDTWRLRSAVVHGQDLLDTGVAVMAGETLRDVVVMLADRLAEISGMLSTADGAPLPEYSILVFPADESLWRRHGRRVKVTRPATDGTFAIRDLPAGDYLIAALTDVTEIEWNDVAFLRSVAPAGVPVVLAQGTAVRQDLRVRR